MKKIALLVYDFSKIGGAERVTCTLANELIKYYDVSIISLLHQYGEVPYKIDNRISCTFINENETYRIRKLITKSRKKLRKILKDNKIDILMCNGLYAGVVGAVDAYKSKTKIVYCDHSSIGTQLNDKKATMMRKIASKLSNYTVVLTKMSLKKYIQLFKTPKEKLCNIYNWIDENIYNFTKEYDSESNKIITASRISEEKGIDNLVKVASKLKKLNSNWTWDVYGVGPDFEKIQESIKELKLEKNVFLKGQENNIYKKYPNYGLYVLTSYREGLPLVLLEAKANNLPIVSFDIETGPNEIIKNNVNGYLIKPYDVDEMAKKINELLIDKGKRIEFSKNCKVDLEKFSKDKIIQQWIDLIEKI